MIDYFVNQFFFMFIAIQFNILITIIINYRIEALLYPYHKQLKYSLQKQYKPIINDLSDYKKLYTNTRTFVEKIIHDRNKTEKVGIRKEKEKKFNDLFVSDSDDIKSISVLSVKKILVDNCIYKTNGFCVIYIHLNICFKMPFHYLRFLFY